MAGPNVKKAVPFFWVSDMAKSIQYYVDGLGFKLINKWIHEDKIRWCCLEHGEAVLMLQEFWKEGHHKNLPQHKLGEGVSICFICQDALSLYLDYISRGIDAAEPFVGNGMWVVGMADPDGYNLTFESYTDVPEETKYSQWRRSRNS